MPSRDKAPEIVDAEVISETRVKRPKPGVRKVAGEAHRIGQGVVEPANAGTVTAPQEAVERELYALVDGVRRRPVVTLVSLLLQGIQARAAQAQPSKPKKR